MEAKLTCDTIGDLADGQSRGIINAALAAAVADTEDRGSDEKPRKVTIEVTLTKIDRILAVEVSAKTSLPTYRTDRTACRIGIQQSKRGPQPVLMFQEYCPSNPDQDTLDKHVKDDGDIIE